MTKGSKMSIEQRERLRIAHLGQRAWNKGVPMNHSGSFKNGHGDLVSRSSRVAAGEKLTNEKHPNWKGDDVGYSALHIWIRRHFGVPRKCEDCGESKGKMEWANVSGRYLRIQEDWKRLCVRCHRIFDKHPFFKKQYAT